MNFVQLVGRITELPEKRRHQGNEFYSELKLAVKNNFKAGSKNGETQEFSVILWRGISDKIRDVCTEDELVAIKGRLELYEGQYTVVAEHVEVY